MRVEYDEYLDGDATKKDLFEAGAQSRQTEVDKLQTEIDGLKIELSGSNERCQILLNHKNRTVDKMQAEIDELQKRIAVYEKHVNAIKNIHENEFDMNSDTSWILGNLDGFFECLYSDLKGEQND